MAKKDPITHTLIPKHKKLSEKDKKALLEKYKITEKELPSIHKSDPALRGTDMEVGTVIKIERDSLTAGNTVYYRCVLE